MSSRSLIGGNLSLNSLTVKHLTVTDTSDNVTEIENIECATIDASEKVTCPAFSCPDSDYNVGNISNPQCTNGLTIGTGDSDGSDFET